MSEHLCDTDCGRPAPDSSICRHCRWLLERDLGDVGALGQHLAAELDVALSRLVRIGSGSGGRRSAETPLPFDLEASEALSVLRSALVGWVRELEPTVAQHPGDDVESMARWLLARSVELANHDAGGEAFDELTSAVGNARRAVDRPVSRIFAGVCGTGGCTGRVYGWPAREVARCEACGAGFDVEARRAEMLAELDGRLFTAAEIATLSVYLGSEGRQRARKLLNLWASRGLLEVRGVAASGDPTYRFGDVIDRLLGSLRHAESSRSVVKPTG